MQTFSQFLEIIENFISKEQFDGKSNGLYEPLYYIFDLPAKRVRPALVLLGHQLFKEDCSEIVPLAFVVEAFHNFTLIHDDIMDDAPLRRGRATVHEKFGINTGILSGDLLLIYVYEYIRRHAPQDKLNKILDCFNKMAIEVCEGQQMDMDFEKIAEVSLEDYIQMIKFKTAVLLGASLKIGAIAAGSTDYDCELCNEVGINLGLAFQIQDDYLDIYGDNIKVGKQKAGDIINSKKSAPYILALQSLIGSDKENFIHLYESGNIDPIEKVDKVLQVYEKANIPGKIKELKHKFQLATLEKLDQISAPEANKDELLQLIEKLLDRSV